MNTEEELFELAKSLGIIYHPINVETGKENVQMWQIGKHDPVRGEANMKAEVLASKALQLELELACNNVSNDAIDWMNSTMEDDVHVDLDAE